MTSAVVNGAVIGLIGSIIPSVGILLVWRQSRAGFAGIHRQFDAMEQHWRSELRRWAAEIDARQMKKGH